MVDDLDFEHRECTVQPPSGSESVQPPPLVDFNDLGNTDQGKIILPCVVTSLLY